MIDNNVSFAARPECMIHRRRPQEPDREIAVVLIWFIAHVVFIALAAGHYISWSLPLLNLIIFLLIAGGRSHAKG